MGNAQSVTPVTLGAGYQDFFNGKHTNTSPEVLIDGTSVQWPPTWSLQDALRWRKVNGLERPRTGYTNTLPILEIRRLKLSVVPERLSLGRPSRGGEDWWANGQTGRNGSDGRA